MAGVLGPLNMRISYPNVLILATMAFVEPNGAALDLGLDVFGNPADVLKHKEGAVAALDNLKIGI